MVTLALLVGDNGDNVGAVVDDASLEPAEKNIERPKNPQWHKEQELTSLVGGRQSLGKGHCHELSLFCGPLRCKAKAKGENTSVHGFVLFLISPLFMSKSSSLAVPFLFE